MKILSPRVHGVLDFVVVAAFALAPSLLDFSATPATVSYVLSAVHLLLTLTTAFPFGVLKLIPFPVHGAIELVVSVALVALPWVLGFAHEVVARNFYVAFGAVVFLVWLTTDYKAASAPARASV